MCMEDIRIGRRTRASTRFVPVTTTPVQLSQRSPDRIALLISSLIPVNGDATANRLTISTDPAPVDQQGMMMWAGKEPMQLTIHNHGVLVSESLYCVSDNVSAIVGITEVFLNED